MVALSVDVDKAVVCRLKHSGESFEILVDPKNALEFKRGIKTDLNDILAYPAIYKKVGTADAVPDEDLQKVFGTTDVMVIADRILKNGELQLTTEQRKEMVEEKEKQIADMISVRGVNPQTNTPHPPQRIMNVMEEAGVKIDPFTDAELQMDGVVKAIKAYLPISFQKVVIAIRVQPQYAGHVYPILKKIGTLKTESWQNDGSLKVEVELLAGMQQELYDKIAGLTHGNYESKVVSRVDL